MLMGSYAAAAGCLFSYQSQMGNGTTMSGTALISDEQLHPRRSNYHGLYNFWDSFNRQSTAPVDGVGAVSELEDHASVLSAVYGSALPAVCGDEASAAATTRVPRHQIFRR
jgi:hypothetical protein